MRVRILFDLVACGTLVLTSTGHAAQQSPAQHGAPPPAATQTDSVANPTLRRELLARMEQDQQARMRLIDWMRERGQGDPHQVTGDDPRLADLRKVDQENRAWLKQLIEKSGWPGASQVGVDGAHAAWLLVQHADDAPDFQKHCLELMRKTPPGDVSSTDVAYLTDRVMIKETGKQLYGTQVRLNQGKWEPLPLAEPQRVDALRKEVQMAPLAEYLELVAKLYSGAPRGDQPASDADKSK